jgi:hypothetical protein
MPETAPASPSSAPAPHVGAGAPVPTKPAEVEAAPKVEAEKPAPKPTHKFKAGGKDVEVPLEELEKHYGTFAASQARLKEAAETKKTVEAEKAKILTALKSGDVGTLKEAGLTEDEIDQLAIGHLSAKQQKLLEQERRRSLEPEARELEELREQKAEWGKKEADAKKAEEDRVHAENTAKEERRLTKFMIDALELMPAKYQRHEFMAHRIHDALTYFDDNKEELAKKGFTDANVTPEFIAKQVRAEMRALARLMAEAATDEELDELVPESIAGKVLQRLRAKGMKDAHPALTGEPIVRDGPTKEENKEPVITTAQLMRRAYFPAKRTG